MKPKPNRTLKLLKPNLNFWWFVGGMGLDHNWTSISNGRNWKYDLCTYTKRRHQIFTWKPKLGKNHVSSQTPNKITIWEEEVHGETRRQQPRSLSLRQLAVTNKNTFYISLSSLSLCVYLNTFRVESSIKLTEYEAPPSDWCGIGPQTSEWTRSSGLDSLGADVGCDAATCLPYWQCS